MASKLDEIVRGFLAGLPVIGKKFQDDEEYDDDDTVIEDGDFEDSDEEADDEAEDEDDSEEEDDEEAAKKKKKTLIIRGVIVLVLVYFAYDTLMNDGSDNPNSGDTEVSTNLSPEEMAIQKRIKAKREKRQKEKAAKEKAAKEKAEAEAKKKREEAAAAQKRAQEEAERERKAREEAEKKAAAELEEIEKQAKLLAEQKKKAEELAKAATENAQSDQSAGMDQSDVIKQMEKQIEREDSPAQKVTKYYAPPNYENVGRGLVYNCKGKFWACVDRKSYFSCRKNERFQTQSKKKLECHIFNVYGSTEDCKVMQAYNVNMNTPTNFCD